MAAKDMDKIKALFTTGNYVSFPIRNCILEWAQHLNEPDITEWDPIGKFKVNAIISDEVAEEMKYVGFNVKKNKDDQQYVQPKRKVALGKPIVVDTDGNPVDASKIGNGTIATIECTCKHFKIGGNESLPIYIEKVIIEDLVEYEGGSESVDPFGG